MSEPLVEKEYTLEAVSVTPYFDMELVIQMNHSNTLDGKTFGKLADTWETWIDKLHVDRIAIRKNQYLLVWLEESVEEDVNKAWDDSPNDGFALTGLAQAMLMEVIRELVPEVAADGCAPAPKPFPALIAAMRDAGVDWADDTTLSRQFAMITHYPYKGGCAACYLSKSCPNAKLGR